MKAVSAICVLVAVALCGCRSVYSGSKVVNNFTAGNDIVMDRSGSEVLQEGTQAADKKVGDIAPKANVAAGPASSVEAPVEVAPTPVPTPTPTPTPEAPVEPPE